MRHDEVLRVFDYRRISDRWDDIPIPTVNKNSLEFYDPIDDVMRKVNFLHYIKTEGTYDVENYDTYKLLEKDRTHFTPPPWKKKDESSD